MIKFKLNIMYSEDDKRAIDDPGLNQDSIFDKKDEEDFDNSDDFHKYDDTAQDKQSKTEHSDKKKFEKNKSTQHRSENSK